MITDRDRIRRKMNRRPSLRGKKQEAAGPVMGIMLLIMSAGAGWVWQEAQQTVQPFKIENLWRIKTGKIPVEGYIPANLILSENTARRLLMQKD